MCIYIFFVIWSYYLDYNLLKFGTFVLLFSSIVALIGVLFLCPLRWSRNMFMKKLLKARQHKKNKQKTKRRNFFDTRSISANTEFDFTPITASENRTNEGEPSITHQPPFSALNNTGTSKRSMPVTPPEATSNDGGFKTLHRNASQESNTVDPLQTRSILSNYEKNVNKNDSRTQPTSSMKPSASIQKSTSFGTLSSYGGGNISLSRGQLVKDRKPSVVTFEMDKTQQNNNKYNTIATEVKFFVF